MVMQGGIKPTSQQMRAAENLLAVEELKISGGGGRSDDWRRLSSSPRQGSSTSDAVRFPKLIEASVEDESR